MNQRDVDLIQCLLDHQWETAIELKALVWYNITDDPPSLSAVKEPEWSRIQLIAHQGPYKASVDPDALDTEWMPWIPVGQREKTWEDPIDWLEYY